MRGYLVRTKRNELVMKLQILSVIGYAVFLTVAIHAKADALTPLCKRSAEIKSAVLWELEKTDCKKVSVAEMASLKRLRNIQYKLNKDHLKAADLEGFSSLSEITFSVTASQIDEDLFSSLPALRVLTIKFSKGFLLEGPKLRSASLESLDLLILNRGGYSGDTWTISDSAFANLPSLKTLSLYGTPSLSEKAFIGVMHLKELSFFSPKISDGLFQELSGLESLTFQRIPYIWGGEPSRDSPGFTFTTETFKGLKALKRLSITRAGIGECSNPSCGDALPVGVFSDLQNLEELDLSQNQIKSVDERVFSTLTQLKVLNLHENNLQRFSSNTLRGQNNLERLDLSYNWELSNSVHAIFDSIKNLPRLRELNLSEISVKCADNNRGNCLFDWKIPVNSFVNLTSLEKLYLAGNAFLLEGSRAFLPLKTLRELDVSSNYFAPLGGCGFGFPEDRCRKADDMSPPDLNGLLNLKQIRLATAGSLKWPQGIKDSYENAYPNVKFSW